MTQNKLKIVWEIDVFRQRGVHYRQRGVHYRQRGVHYRQRGVRK